MLNKLDIFSLKKSWAKKYKRPEPKVNPMREIIVPRYVPKIIPANMAIGELNPRKKAQKKQIRKTDSTFSG